MNTWIWHLTHNAATLTYRHGTKTFSIPRCMLVGVPPFLTDANIADLKAAFARDRDRLPAKQTH